MRKIMLSIVAIFAISNMSLAAGNRMIAETKTTFGWKTATDQAAEFKLAIVPGPKKLDKAIGMSYEFKDSVWIALVKQATFSLAPNEGVFFRYKGTGAMVNMIVKVFDSKGTAFGYTLPGGTAVSTWQKVFIARSDFAYLWGGSGAGSMSWDSLAKFEITLDANINSDMTYAVDTTKPGKIALADIKVVKAGTVKTSIPKSASVQEKSKGKRTKSGYMIDDLQSTKGWNGLADQDGSCLLSSVKATVGKKSFKVMKVSFDFGSKGSWEAVIKPTNLDLSKMEFLSFRYKGKGGSHRLVLKLMDKGKQVYGYPVSTPTKAEKWTKVVVPKKSLQYFYGGSNSGALDFANIRKIEFTIEKEESSDSRGSLYLRELMYK